MEEYTGTRTCDLCEYGRNLPCKNKGCNSANSLKDFKLKGVKPEGSPKWSIDSFTYIKEDDHMVFHLKSESEGTIMVELSPDEIASFINLNL
jgi:hypothetical protein